MPFFYEQIYNTSFHKKKAHKERTNIWILLFFEQALFMFS